MTRDASEAEDAVQDTLLKAWRKSGSIRCGEARWSWLFMVLRNCIRSRARKKTRHGGLVLLPSWEDQADPQAENGRYQDEATDDSAQRIECLVSLAASYQEILEAVYVYEISIAEFAKVQGITSNNAKVRLFRARKALRRTLEQAATPESRHIKNDELSAVSCTTPRESES